MFPGSRAAMPFEATNPRRRAARVVLDEHRGYASDMSDQEEEPQTIPSLRGMGEAMTEEEEARKTTSPEAGYPAAKTEPYEGLTGDEGRVNAEATPDIADDAEKGQTESPPA